MYRKISIMQDVTGQRYFTVHILSKNHLYLKWLLNSLWIMSLGVQDSRKRQSKQGRMAKVSLTHYFTPSSSLSAFPSNPHWLHTPVTITALHILPLHRNHCPPSLPVHLYCSMDPFTYFGISCQPLANNILLIPLFSLFSGQFFLFFSSSLTIFLSSLKQN